MHRHHFAIGTLVLAITFGLAVDRAIAVGNLPIPTTEIEKYLLIGTTSNAIAKAVNVQNGDLGANIVVLSTEINDNVDFDNDDVFLKNAGKRWVNVNNSHSNASDYLPGAARLREGVSWTGDVALTSPNAKFDMSNVELYGQAGVVSAGNSPASSLSNSKYFSDGLGNGFDTTGTGLTMPSKGVIGGVNLAPLRAEIKGVETFITGLAPEVTLKPGFGLPSSSGIENVPYFELNVDPFDTNNDGIAVIDIWVDNGNSDFQITNSNWVIETEKSTLAIFRILGSSNFVLNQSSILMGDGILGNQYATGPSDPATEIGALFVKANQYSNGTGGFRAGESLQSGDTTFSFNNTVLNGIAFYDLIAFSDANNSAFNDNGKTELNINNGQGFAQFLSPKINFNNVRFEHFNPEPGPPLIPENPQTPSGAPAPPAVNPIPEPTTAVFALMGLFALGHRRRRVA